LDGAYAAGVGADAGPVAAPHPDLGQGIVLVCSPSYTSPAFAGEVARSAGEGSPDALLAFLKSRLPNFMIPHHLAWLDELPRNPNGKFDRPALAAQFRDVLQLARVDA
jgi:acyl-CoA synthetase (AMP-forming)/AMP-acid ligase II